MRRASERGRTKMSEEAARRRTESFEGAVDLDELVRREQ